MNFFLNTSSCQWTIGFMFVIDFELMSKCILTIFFKPLKKVIFSTCAKKRSKENYDGKNGIIAASHVAADFNQK